MDEKKIREYNAFKQHIWKPDRLVCSFLLHNQYILFF